MFLVLAFALFSAQMHGGRACKYTGELPRSISANVGENVTLGCPTDFGPSECDRNQCSVTWHREINGNFTRLCSCFKDEDVVDRFSMSDGPDWSLSIIGVQPEDYTRRYRCKVRLKNSSTIPTYRIVNIEKPQLSPKDVKWDSQTQSAPTSVQTQQIVPEISTIKPAPVTTNRFWLGLTAAVILIIALVIACLVFRGRIMTRSNFLTSRGDDKTDAVESAETHRIKSAQTPMSSTGARAEHHRDQDGESTHQYAEVDDVSLPTGQPTSFDCGYKPARSNPVYARVKKSHARNGSTSAPAHAAKVSPKDGPNGDVVTAEGARSDGRDGTDEQEPAIDVEVAPVAAGSKPDGAPTGKKPPRVTPYHLSKSRTHTGTEAKSDPPEQTADRGGDGVAKDDPILRNAEGLVYADLDIPEGSPMIVICKKEKTLYAGIVNKETIRNLREGSIYHAR